MTSESSVCKIVSKTRKRLFKRESIVSRSNKRLPKPLPTRTVTREKSALVPIFKCKNFGHNSSKRRWTMK